MLFTWLKGLKKDLTKVVLCRFIFSFFIIFFLAFLKNEEFGFIPSSSGFGWLLPKMSLELGWKFRLSMVHKAVTLLVRYI